MAKYCSKCGKAIPDGEEKCPSCHADEPAKDDAALFTRMTAETEVWKEPQQPGKKRKRKRAVRKLRSMRERLMLYAAAVLLVAATAFVIIYTQPYSEVMRELRHERYDSAAALYIENYPDGSSADGRIERLILKKADEVCSSYEDGHIDTEGAEAAFAGLYAIGLADDGLDERYDRFAALRGTQSQLEQAERLAADGKYLEACDIYLAVPADESAYAEAQEAAQRCLADYGKSVAAAADAAMAEKDFSTAISALNAGSEKLLAYDTFSSDIDAKLDECCTKYADFAMSEAKALADLGNYEDAAAVIEKCMSSPVGRTEELEASYNEYLSMSDVKTATDAISKANEFYRSGEYAEAFRELDTAAARLDDPTTVNEALASLEALYVSDMKRQALETAREDIPAALKALSGAISVRGLDELRDFYDELDACLPLDLATASFASREGEVYRSTAAFESLDGTKYSEGWIWGADGASITYTLDGKYDRFEGCLAARRDDGKSVSGYFEVWCDGELLETSEKLGHSADTVQFGYEITGCRELKIVFRCDYSTVTGDGGYCYHGICTPQVIKNLPEK